MVVFDLSHGQPLSGTIVWGSGAGKATAMHTNLLSIAERICPAKVPYRIAGWAVWEGCEGVLKNGAGAAHSATGVVLQIPMTKTQTRAAPHRWAVVSHWDLVSAIRLMRKKSIIALTGSPDIIKLRRIVGANGNSAVAKSQFLSGLVRIR